MKKLVAVILCLSLLLLSFPMRAGAAGPYDINVLAGEGGKIALAESGPPETGNISVGEGGSITLYVIPYSHYSITDVMVDGVSQGAILQYTFSNVMEAHSITASFTRNTKTITVAPVVNGEIRVNGMGENNSTITVDEGSDVNIDVRPNAGREIESITIGEMTYSLDGEIGDRTGEFSRTVTANDNFTVSAVFRTVRHSITTNIGPNGTINPMNPQVNHGSDQTFTINPNEGYRILSLTVDGNPASVDENNQITLYNVQSDRTMSVDFAENSTYTITTIVGEHGSLTPEDPVVAQGADVTFTIAPDPGYMIDELRVDGFPEMPDESGQFTVFNVQRSMTLNVSFREVETFTILLSKPTNGNIQIVDEPLPVPSEGVTIDRNTGEMVSLFVMPAEGYAIAGVYYTDADGFEDELSWAIGYDEAAGLLRLDFEPMFSGTLRFEFETALPAVYESVAILSAEAQTEPGIKAAIMREYGLRLMPVGVDQITDISAMLSSISDNGVPFGVISANVGDQPVNIYVVNSITNLLFKLGLSGNEHIFITEETEPFAQEVMFEIAEFQQGTFEYYAPFNARLMGISDNISSCFEPVDGFQYKQHVVSPFYRAQFHVANNGQGENQLNWFPFTLVQENALCFNAVAVAQEASAWSLDTFPHVTEGNSTQEIFFGNNTLTLVPPVNGEGNILSMTAEASLSRGYVITNNPDGTITIDFMSDFYDRIDVTLTIVLQSGGTVQRTLTLHRVGVDIHAHDSADGNPSPTRTVFHGTQYGSLVNFSENIGYSITASYFLPDLGSELPYGLYVTRRYADGKIETETILQPMNSPHPASENLFEDGIFFYNDGDFGMANAVDYLIFEGTSRAAAPVEVTVLVLKNAPDGSVFGGVDFGSGTGVKWSRK